MANKKSSKKEEKKSFLSNIPLRYKIIGVEVIISLIGIIILTVWISATNKSKQEADMVNDTYEAVIAELERCEEFVTGEEGDFEELDYCRGFLEWTGSNGINAPIEE